MNKKKLKIISIRDRLPIANTIIIIFVVDQLKEINPFVCYF